MRFSVFEHPDGYATGPGRHVLYDVAANAATFGAARADGRALRFELEEHDPNGAKLSVDVDLDRAVRWLVRCDRVDFPPGGIAYRHVHPGPGIRCLLEGELRVAGSESVHVVEPLQAWFEGADYPVVAAASPIVATSFVRVMLLPREWAGKRTIHYLDPADADRPKTQTATVFLEEPLET
jgi:hypothetical protein